MVNRKRPITYSCRVTAEEFAYLQEMNSKIGACSVRDGVMTGYKLIEQQLSTAQEIARDLAAADRGATNGDKKE